MFKGCTFDNQNITSKNDGGMYQNIYSGGDGVLWGCSISVTTDTLTIQPGELMIGGRLIWVDGATQVPFPSPIANGFGQVILTIDLSKTATLSDFGQVEASVVYSTTTTFPDLTQGDINSENGDMVYQQELAVVSIAGSNITGITRQIGNAQIDAAKLGGQLPAYYATKAAVDDKIPLAKLSESASGNITAVSGNVYYGKWQKRNGWVRLSMYCTAATVANGGTWFQIVGAGLVGETKFTGTCVLSNGGMALALCSVSAGGSMKVENSSGSNMTGMVFDVTLPAQYP